MSYMVERAADQLKKVNLKDLISKENLDKLAESMEYETKEAEDLVG